MTRRSVRRVRQHRAARRRLALRGGPLAAAAFVLVTAGTALTAGLGGLPTTTAGRNEDPWPAFALTAGPTYPDATTVTFAVSPAAGQTRARVNDGSNPDWSQCTSGDGGASWSCTVTTTTGTFEWVATP